MVSSSNGSFVGVDGCKDGWLAAAITVDSVGVTVFPSFKELLAKFSTADIVLVDMPIGLVEGGPDERVCDRVARSVLGPRQFSVFPAPCRAAVSASRWEEASATNRTRTGKGLSLLSWAILPKIREVDALLTNVPEGARPIVREGHPEVLFWALDHRRPMQNKKSRVAGRLERLEVLRRYLPNVEQVVRSALKSRNGARYKADDVIDALAAAVTASRGLG